MKKLVSVKCEFPQEQCGFRDGVPVFRPINKTFRVVFNSHHGEACNFTLINYHPRFANAKNFIWSPRGDVVLEEGDFITVVPFSLKKHCEIIFEDVEGLEHEKI